MPTAQDIITGALRFINVYSPGETLDASDSDDALITLNDLLQSLSTDDAAVYASAENVFTFVANQYRYTIGNYAAGTFAATVTALSATLTLATIPADMKIGGDISGPGIAAGATILNFNTGLGTVTMSLAATSNAGPQQIAYTIPGDFKMTRPLRVTNAFTRIYTAGSGLDYPIDIVDQSRYVEIGYKAVNAPWPIIVWYNPTMPLGEMWFYQNPSGAAELHLFTDNILTDFSALTTDILMPQGYSRMLKRLLARELAPEYGAIWTQQRENLTKEAVNAVKSLNKNPPVVTKYDSVLIQDRRTDAGWILSGGFNR